MAVPIDVIWPLQSPTTNSTTTQTKEMGDCILGWTEVDWLWNTATTTTTHEWSGELKQVCFTSLGDCGVLIVLSVGRLIKWVFKSWRCCGHRWLDKSAGYRIPSYQDSFVVVLIFGIMHLVIIHWFHCQCFAIFTMEDQLHSPSWTAKFQLSLTHNLLRNSFRNRSWNRILTVCGLFILCGWLTPRR